ncbi:MAG: glycosyltransferase family 4 protein [Candidatus Nanoarchaeia archaeon]|nr:glycosyltransferase family 4 protein [Candidatus Nanoarchaeia archaeon]
MKKLKIAFICIYSHPSICGVWSRVYNLSEMLIKKGHEVHVFSTNIIKGTSENSSSSQVCNGIKIHRFSPKASFGENVRFWNFSSELEKLNPDFIVAEVYRHPHTSLALKVAKKLNKPCFLVTHAPFVEPELRSRLGNFIANFYDRFYGKKIINKFDKIITITSWEIPYLSKLGVNQKKLVYIPNGIPERFFMKKRTKGKYLLFLGRISPVKNLESLILAMPSVIRNYPGIKLRIAGPSESDYLKKLMDLVKELRIGKSVEFLPAVYDLDKKIDLIDSSEIFILPSKREAMPQSLIEVMSRGKIVIASDNKGSSEIIDDGKTGFLFKVSDSKQLADRINYCLDRKNSIVLSKIRKNAIIQSKNFKWSKIFTKFYNLLK